ncbi:uncharacterized protein LOC144574887 [Carex rostrata]
MAVKNLWFGILILCITTFMIGVQAQAGHGESSQQPESIRRITAESNDRRAISRGGFESNRSSSDAFFHKSTSESLANAGDTEEAHAMYITTNQNLTGFVASLTVYDLAIKRGQMSRSYIVIQNNNEDEEIAAGWAIDPWMYGDSKTRFFIYWKGPGCTNVECHNGFVYQQGAYLAPGDILDGGNHMTIKFLKDGAGNWVLYTGPSDAYVSKIGYFPASLLTDLPVQAARASFGGGVRFIDNLESPPMGNGVFAKDNIPPGQPTPAWMTGVNFVRPDGSYYPIGSYTYRLGYLNCYGLGKFVIDNDHFVYGGPGGCYS